MDFRGFKNSINRKVYALKKDALIFIRCGIFQCREGPIRHKPLHLLTYILSVNRCKGSLYTHGLPLFERTVNKDIVFIAQIQGLSYLIISISEYLPNFWLPC